MNCCCLAPKQHVTTMRFTFSTNSTISTNSPFSTNSASAPHAGQSGAKVSKQHRRCKTNVLFYSWKTKSISGRRKPTGGQQKAFRFQTAQHFPQIRLPEISTISTNSTNCVFCGKQQPSQHLNNSKQDSKVVPIPCSRAAPARVILAPSFRCI